MPRPRLLILLALVATVLVVVSGVLDSGGKSEPPRVAREVTAAGAGAGSTDSQGGRERADRGLPVRRALGQTIVARFDGAEPSPAFLGRLRAGKAGGVILFEENLGGGRAAIASRIAKLQRAARQGGNPPLLVMTDQEGGPVRRLAGPPRLPARSLTSASAARAAGEATGKLLRGLGINVDLAPVADVGHPGSFLGTRTFSSSPATVAARACEFAAGLHGEGVAATLKHFPGLGMASVSTDESSVTIDASPARIRADYAPYRACGAQPLTLVMVGSAVYPKLTGPLPAVMSPLVYSRELPRAGVSAVTISDALGTPAIETQMRPARRSLEAGLDLLLYANAEAESADAFGKLLADVKGGALDGRVVSTAAARVIALKHQLSQGRSM